jgi:hypothetical protein
VADNEIDDPERDMGEQVREAMDAKDPKFPLSACRS